MTIASSMIIKSILILDRQLLEADTRFGRFGSRHMQHIKNQAANNIGIQALPVCIGLIAEASVKSIWNANDMRAHAIR